MLKRTDYLDLIEEIRNTEKNQLMNILIKYWSRDGMNGNENFECLDILNNTIILGGCNSFLGQESIIMFSNNYGNNWDNIYSGNGIISDIQILDSTTLIALEKSRTKGNTLQTKLIITKDKGKNWIEIKKDSLLILSFAALNINNITIKTDESNYIEKKFGGLYNTSDLGKSWKDIMHIERADLISKLIPIKNTESILGIYRSPFNKDSTKIFRQNLRNDCINVTKLTTSTEFVITNIDSLGNVRLIGQTDSFF